MTQVRLILALHNHQPVGNFDGVFEDGLPRQLPAVPRRARGLPGDPVRPAHLGAAPGVAGRAPAGVHRPAPADGRGRPGRDPGRRLLRADPDDDPPPRPGRADPELLAIPRGDSSAPGSAGCGSPSGSGSSTSSPRSPRPGSSTRSSTTPTSSAPAARADDVLRLLPHRGRRPAAQGLPRLRTLRYTIPFQRAARDLRIPPPPGRAPARRRRWSSPTTARSSAPGPRRTSTSIQTAGSVTSATCSWPTATGSRPRPAPGPSTRRCPMGKVYLPDGSYREMTEWALPPDASAAYRRASRRVEAIDDGGESARVLPRRRLLAQLQGEVRRVRRDVRPDAGRLPPPGRARGRRLGRPRLPGRRPAGALSRPVQLPLLARLLRRALSAPPPQRDLPQPDRRRQRPGRRRGPDRPAGRARGRPTSTSTPARRSAWRTTT